MKTLSAGMWGMFRSKTFSISIQLLRTIPIRALVFTLTQLETERVIEVI